MSHNFKPGDLAMIVKSFPECAENFGRCVEVVEVDHPVMDKFPIRVAADNLKGVCQFSGAVESVNFCWCAPSCLIPLRGDFTLEQQKAKEAV